MSRASWFEITPFHPPSHQEYVVPLLQDVQKTLAQNSLVRQFTVHYLFLASSCRLDNVLCLWDQIVVLQRQRKSHVILSPLFLISSVSHFVSCKMLLLYKYSNNMLYLECTIFALLNTGKMILEFSPRKLRPCTQLGRISYMLRLI